ncbi:MAG: exosortase H [Thiohalocapsa sp.]
MNRFFIGFLVIVISLFVVEATTVAQQSAVVPFTSGIATTVASILQLFDPQVGAHETMIWDKESEFAVTIEEGCNGVEASLVLIAAITAFPALWRQKLIGIAVGVFTVQALNLVRVITLFYLGQWSEVAFEWAHLYLWQALIMLDVLIVFLYWLHWISSSKQTR